MQLVLYLDLDVRRCLALAVNLKPLVAEHQPVHALDLKDAGAGLGVHAAQYAVLGVILLQPDYLVVEARRHAGAVARDERGELADLDAVVVGDLARYRIFQRNAPLGTLAGFPLGVGRRGLGVIQFKHGRVGRQAMQCSLIGAAHILVTQRQPFIAGFGVVDHTNNGS